MSAAAKDVASPSSASQLLPANLLLLQAMRRACGMQLMRCQSPIDLEPAENIAKTYFNSNAISPAPAEPRSGGVDEPAQ